MTNLRYGLLLLVLCLPSCATGRAALLPIPRQTWSAPRCRTPMPIGALPSPSRAVCIDRRW